jgi:hypothetical protein
MLIQVKFSAAATTHKRKPQRNDVKDMMVLARMYGNIPSMSYTLLHGILSQRMREKSLPQDFETLWGMVGSVDLHAAPFEMPWTRFVRRTAARQWDQMMEDARSSTTSKPKEQEVMCKKLGLSKADIKGFNAARKRKQRFHIWVDLCQIFG